jgi:hypothetical protein
LLASALSTGWVNIAGFAHDIGCGFDLGQGAFVDGLGFEIVLVAAEPPTAEIVFIEVFAGIAEFFDDSFVGNTVVDHVVDLFAKGGRETGDLAVPTGFGLASLEGQGIGEME